MREQAFPQGTECESCAASGRHGVLASHRTSNPDYEDYALCAECAAEYDRRLFHPTEDGALEATVRGYKVEIWRARGEGEGDPGFPWAYRVHRQGNATGDVAESEANAIRYALDAVEAGYV